MSSNSTPEPSPSRSGTARLRLAEGAMLAAFLGLTFLLGVFPLKDVDFWWHLRTGDLIRQTGEVPTTDPYTYTVPDHRWVDLHWGFQVLLSLGYQLGGVVGLNLAKCAITTLAVGLLITARRRDWPLWAMALAWLPALLLLAGRMYIRPETLTLLYLSIYLAVLLRWEETPRLAFVLPVAQVFWVNTQGLFVFGPILLTFALIDAVLRPDPFAPERRRFWRTALASTGLVGLACLVNPYGLRGALFPFTDLLLGTLSDPIFKRTIAELSSIGKLIADTAGYPHLLLILHLGVALLGGLSFVVPIAWVAAVRLSKAREAAASSKKALKRREARSVPPSPIGWSIRPFRLLLFAAFTALSWQATRNSHQFAAVVGTVTAWNLGEWAAALRRRREERGVVTRPPVGPTLVALGATLAVIAWVGTGKFYEATEEGRTIGLGEEPAWFPHRAVEFAGSDGLPPRFLGFHIGHDALFIYHCGPERKVYIDPRLEVMGADQYRRYIQLSEEIAADQPGSPWRGELERAGRPVILSDHNHEANVGATFLADPSYRCLWFDEVAAVFAHEKDATAAGLPAVDFLGRHFGTQPPPTRPELPAEWLASAKAWSKYVLVFLERKGRMDLAREIVPIGLDHARVARGLAPDAAGPWSYASAMELARADPPARGGPDRRYLRPFDPTIDLHPARAASFARQALARDEGDQVATSVLLGLFVQMGIDESAIPLLERAIAHAPRSPRQAATREAYQARIDQIRARLGRPRRVETRDAAAVARSVQAMLDRGRVESAVAILEDRFPAGSRDWPTADRIATLWLHLGYPDRARAAWESAESPEPGLRLARLAASHYAEDELEVARSAYRKAIETDPNSFEAWYGLALVEHDAGDADASREAARRAIDTAPDELARASARAIERRVAAYAGRAGGSEG